MSKEQKKENTFGIGTVAQLTGLTTYALRMWERRYGAVVAERSPNGRRFYRPEDVEKLSLLKALTDRGNAISTIANLSLEELRERAEQLELMQTTAPASEITVAVMGAFLPGMLTTAAEQDERLTLVAAGSDLRRFGADVRDLKPGILVLEVAVLEDATIELIEKLVRDSGAANTLVVYGFAHSQEVQRMKTQGVRLLRSPVTPDELVMTILATTGGAPAKATAGSGKARRQSERLGSMIELSAPPMRRYSPEQLGRLTGMHSTIDCECPKHLADILNTLGAFEVYSQECEDRDAKDAELHAYLHAATAHARGVMEEALARLAEAEGLDI